MHRSGTRLAAVATLLLSACLGRSPVPVFYTLTPVVPEAAAGGDGPMLAVGPARLPSYLDRPQIASRQGSRVAYDEYRRWASPLEAELLRVLGANLGNLLHTERVVVYPNEPRFAVDYRISLQVERFDGQPGSEVVLETRWAITRPGATSADVIGLSRIRQPASGSGDDDYVAAHSEAVGALSREIAERVRQLAAPKDAPGS